MAYNRKRSGRSHPARGNHDQHENLRAPYKRFLIVCEGTKTEPNYFRGFRARHRPVDVEGFGVDALSLVRAAIRLNDDTYEEVWCVFDLDDAPARIINDALALARRHKIKIAYSNQAFELWYVLHFEYLNAAMNRDAYITKIAVYLGRPYRKNDPTMYEALKDLQPQAIQNAVRLMSQYSPPKPVTDDPSTMVHQLVEALNAAKAS